MLISFLLVLMALGGLKAALRKDATYDAFVVSYGTHLRLPSFLSLLFQCLAPYSFSITNLH